MAEFKTIPIDKIAVPERLRAVEEDHALAIQASIVEHGLINPITVRFAPNSAKGERPYILIAGAHRLRAIELLDEAEIDAFVVEADAAEGQLLEITENLFRNELSALDRAVFVMKYREVWEEKHGRIEAGRPGNRANIAQLVEDEAKAGFSTHVADRLGLSTRSVKYAQFVAQRLSPDLRQRLRGTPAADNQSQLLKLAKLPAERQQLIRAGLDLGQALDEAIGHSDPAAAAKATKSATAKRRDAVIANFHGLSKADRGKMLRDLMARYPDEAAWALANAEGGAE